MEAEEKTTAAYDSIKVERWSDSIYHSYAAFVNAAKAMLTAEGVKNNTQAGIIKAFDETFVSTGLINLSKSFGETVFQIKTNEPTEAFAKTYLEQSIAFIKTIEVYRQKQLQNV